MARKRTVIENMKSRKHDKGYRKGLAKLRESMSDEDFEFLKTKTLPASAHPDNHQNYLWHSNFQVERLFLRWGGYKKFTNSTKFKNINTAFQKVRGEEIFDDMLEVGCGHGHWLYHWRNCANNIVGLDHSLGMVESCKEKLRKVGKNMSFMQGDCWKLPFENKSFDFVFMIDVTMHIGGSWKAIQEMMRVSRKYIIFTGPSWRPTKWQKMTKHHGMKVYEFKKKQSDMQIGKISWAVNQDFIEARLNHWKRKNRIKKYYYEYRKPSSTYNHKILVIEK